jgi:hypothetical protein
MSFLLTKLGAKGLFPATVDLSTPVYDPGSEVIIDFY